MPSVLTLWRSVGKKLLMEVMIFLLAKIIILTIISIVTWQRTGACQASCYVTLKQRTPHPTSFFIGVIIVAMCGRQSSPWSSWMLTLVQLIQSPSVSFSLFQSSSVFPDKDKDKDKMKVFQTPNACYIFEKVQGFPIWHFPQKNCPPTRTYP